MFECKICGRKLDKVGNLKQHIKKCEKLSVIKDEIVRLYIDESYSVKDLRKKFKMTPADKENTTEDIKINPNIEAVNCYFLFFVSGFMILQREKKNKFVRFHAYQSIYTSLAFLVLIGLMNYIPFIGEVLVQLSTSAFFLLWLYLIYSAYRHQEVIVPFFGDLAKERA